MVRKRMTFLLSSVRRYVFSIFKGLLFVLFTCESFCFMCWLPKVKFWFVYRVYFHSHWSVRSAMVKTHMPITTRKLNLRRFDRLNRYTLTLPEPRPYQVTSYMSKLKYFVWNLFNMYQSTIYWHYVTDKLVSSHRIWFLVSFLSLIIILF